MKHFLFIISIILLSACGNSDKRSIETEAQETDLITLSKEGVELAGISTNTLQPQAITSSVRCLGHLELSAGSKSNVPVPIAGYINAILVQNGQMVRKGQALFKVADQGIVQLQKDFLISQNELARKTQEFNRHQELSRAGAMAARDFEESKTEYENLKAELSALKLQLKWLGINPEGLSPETMRNSIIVRASIAGQIEELNVTTGEYAGAERNLCSISGMSGFRVVCRVFEKDISRIMKGQKIKFFCNLPESHDTTHHATITGVSNSIDINSRTFKVYASPAENYAGLRSGLAIQAEIETGVQEGYAISNDAIVSLEGQTGLFLALSDTSFRFMPVSIEQKGKDFTQISDESLKTKPIVVSGAYYLAAEMSAE